MKENEKYRLLPPPSDEEYAALKADIRARGVMVPIERDGDGNILDGFIRDRICKDLRITCPSIIRPHLAGDQKIDHLLRLNLARRRLPKKELKILAAKLRARGWTQERIASNLPVTQRTISNWLSEFRNFSKLTTVTGKDGKAYPAKKTERILTHPPGDRPDLLHQIAILANRLLKADKLLVFCGGQVRLAEIMGTLSKRLQDVWACLVHLVMQSVGQLLAWVGRQQRS